MVDAQPVSRVSWCQVISSRALLRRSVLPNVRLCFRLERGCFLLGSVTTAHETPIFNISIHLRASRQVIIRGSGLPREKRLVLADTGNCHMFLSRLIDDPRETRRFEVLLGGPCSSPSPVSFSSLHHIVMKIQRGRGGGGACERLKSVP